MIRDRFDILSCTMDHFSYRDRALYCEDVPVSELAEQYGTPLYVYSEAESGKAKRIRRNARVRIAPCDMRGKLLGDWIEARAEIVADEEAGRGMRLLNGKYAPWKQLLDFFSKFKRRGRVVFAIRP